MGKRPCCSKVGLNKGAWTRQEDKILTDYINRHGEGSWNNLPKLAGLKRCGKSCRLRWVNYLRPDVKRGNISQDEEDLIIRMHRLLGNRWSLIAGRLPGRTDNEIKNYWNTTLKKKLDPEQLSKVAFGRRKLSKEKKRKKALEPQNVVESSQVVQPIRTKALRITSKIQTLVPAKFQCPGTAAEHEESEGSSGDRRSTEDRDQPREVAGLDGIDSCYLRDGPQMNDDINIGTSADHDYDNSHPKWDGHGLEDWLICGNANFNEFITGTFEDNLGELDFGSLATLF